LDRLEPQLVLGYRHRPRAALHAHQAQAVR
jgi:hypothetical protein